MIVTDASVLVTALGDDGHDGELLRRRLRGERLIAPHLVDLEVVSAWRRLVAAGAIDDERADRALTDLADLPIERVPHGLLVRRCWQLRENLTIYDAAYVALAELTGAVLLTGDAKLARSAGPVCEIELLGG